MKKTILLLTALMCGSLSVMADRTQHDMTEDDWKYLNFDFFVDEMAFKYLSKEDRTVAVTYMDIREMDRWIYVADTLVIPEKVTYEGIEYTVTAIGESAFGKSKIKHLVIPPSVREIKRRAFGTVEELEELIIPNTVKIIGDEVFAGNMHYLGSSYPKVVVFPETVESLGKGLFAWSGDPFDDRQMATFPRDMKEVPERTYSYSCLKQWKDLPETVEVIGKEAFRGNLFKSIRLPDGLKEIHAEAFRACDNLKSVTIPASVTFIGKLAFSGEWGYGSPIDECGLETLRMLSRVPCTSELELKNTVLVVPMGSKEAYRKAWNLSPDVVIKEVIVTGIDDYSIDTPSAKDTYYNLQGQQLKTAPQKGIYIRNGKKVVIGRD